MIQLTPSQQNFVNAQIAAGAFQDPSEVVQAALELLSNRQLEYAQLADAINQVKKGEVAELNVADIKRRGRLRLDAG
jgi:putative addiction module CopG family antidote